MGSIPAMRVRYIMKSIEKRDRAVYGSIPAMRVRYIFVPFDVIRPAIGFNSRYAGKIHLSR